MKQQSIRVFLWILMTLSGISPTTQAQQLEETLIIDKVPSAFPVRFDLLTEGNRQYIAYYDKDHNMTVAFRTTDQTTWQKKILPTKIAWDSHNYVTIILDANKHLHVSGNMHAVPLIYYRSKTPYDIQSLENIPVLVNAKLENRVTYPRFSKNKLGELYFYYRLGGSGDGSWYFNKYNADQNTWKGLFNGNPLFGNLSNVNAYINGPTLGPDNRYHILYLWRDSPDAATCHTLSYIRSHDDSFDAWENIDGTPLALPITVITPNVVVDPVMIKQGLLNGNIKFGFDSQNRPLISYHKYDANNESQIFNARYSASSKKWDIVQASDWKGFKWDFGGGGSLGLIQVSAGAIQLVDGKLIETYHHIKFGDSTWTLDEATLKPIRTLTQPNALSKIQVDNFIIHLTKDKGAGTDPNLKYVLEWKTLDANRDVQPSVIPPDETLYLKKYRYVTSGIDKSKFSKSKMKSKKPQVIWVDLQGRKRILPKEPFLKTAIKRP